MADILDEITKTTIQLMLDEPFYGHLFSNFNKQVSNSTSSIELILSDKKNISLIVNEEYWNEYLSLSNPGARHQRVGAIKHQLLHIVFKHVFRVKEFKDFNIFGIASDIVVNQYIHENQLNKDAITLDLFRDFNLKSHQTVDYYYEKIKGEHDKMNNYVDLPHRDEYNESQINLNKILNDIENKALKQHNNWKEFQNISNPDAASIESYLNNLILNSYNREKVKSGFGNLPLGIQSQINNILEISKPSVNWKRVLRLFASSSSKTRIKNTIKRPSKRFGTSPGIKVKNKHRLLVALDTSGSISDDDLRSFFGELYHIRKQGTVILIVECDTEIHNKYLYTGAMPEVVSGRGGTSFDEPIKYANDIFMPDALIYFTDGHAPKPFINCRVPILWLISVRGINSDTWDFLPGRKVKMNKI